MHKIKIQDVNEGLPNSIDIGLGNLPDITVGYGKVVLEDNQPLDIGLFGIPNTAVNRGEATCPRTGWEAEVIKSETIKDKAETKGGSSRAIENTNCDLYANQRLYYQKNLLKALGRPGTRGKDSMSCWKSWITPQTIDKGEPSTGWIDVNTPNIIPAETLVRDLKEGQRVDIKGDNNNLGINGSWCIINEDLEQSQILEALDRKKDLNRNKLSKTLSKKLKYGNRCVYTKALAAFNGEQLSQQKEELKLTSNITDTQTIDKKETNVKADRHNQGKPKLSYLSLGKESNTGHAKVWESGAKKYARGNWLKGLPFTEVIDSLKRHLDSFVNGEDLDPESGLPHVDHIQCNAKMLSQYFHTKKEEFDDRVGGKNDSDDNSWMGPLSRGY